MNRVVLSAMAAVFVSGCASTAVWRHPERMGDGHDGATMALAECRAYASGLAPAPMPSTRMDVPPPTSYTSRGTYTQYGNTGYYSGTTRANNSFGSNFASGYNAGASMAEAIEAMQRQDDIQKVTTACMRKLGWVDTSTPAGEATFKQQVSVKSSAKEKQEAQEEASARWRALVKAFIDIEEGRPNGIKYRESPEKMAALDKYVKQLANDPKNDQREAVWFLQEAHKMVLAAFPEQQ
jgi:hypothetical protein